jgi:hypothetical protein
MLVSKMRASAIGAVLAKDRTLFVVILEWIGLAQRVVSVESNGEEEGASVSAHADLRVHLIGNLGLNRAGLCFKQRGWPLKTR